MLDAATLAADAATAIEELASHRAVINGAARIPVIFDARYVHALDVGTVGPAIRVAASDWPDPAQGDVVDIDGINARYTVANPETDGTGTILIRLHKQ
jgi:hypothetical protein